MARSLSQIEACEGIEKRHCEPSAKHSQVLENEIAFFVSHGHCVFASCVP